MKPLLTSPSTLVGTTELAQQKFCHMDHIASDNVKPTEEFHEVHIIDESDRLVGHLFSSRDQAWYFYKGFTWEHGLSERQGTTWLDMEGNVKTQEFCCSKEGFRVSKINIIDRQRTYMPVTRTRCKAKVIVTTTNIKDQWLSLIINITMHCAHLPNRVVEGYHNVGFTHKDLCNALQRGKAKEIVNGDVNALIAYFDYKKHNDPEVFMTYSVDESGWMLKNFLESIMNKSPISIVTDGDRAMQRDIKSVTPYAKHKLCSLHLSRNAQANIGDPKFTAVFSKCMVSWWTTDEFDIHWRSVVSEFNVEKHPWVIEKGNTRHLWAQAYLTDHFFSNIRSTQKCESMNALLAIALKHKKTYLDVVRAIEEGISRVFMNELKSDYLISQTKPFQITKLIDLESHAAEIYTRKSFHLFQEELQQETLYRIQEEIQSLSNNTKDAKAFAPNFVDLNVPPEVMQMARFAALCATSSRLCYIASKTDASFKTARDEMKRLTAEFENLFGLNDSVNRSSVVNTIRDPQRKQRKGKEVPKNKVEKKIKRCGFCNGEGHNKLTCPQVKLSLETSTHPTSTDFFEDGME
ncbi:hypothetical protein F3Y22_tig00110129pilonHSYRG00111 [Hibiscus syriacus]|uniref:Uncharacterized protein n=1 Tax=Hibiscus syriacus TaxID=106335 RepID=A0A6A3BHX2_HIBSY|nr:hypothetical protein F3Y22_tig00110129pilonHSYRG00111 [Hibiscus syriacus]